MAGKVRDYIAKYYDGFGTNCAETTFLAANDAWELGVPQEFVKMMGGFGGGMGVKGICGAVSGGAAALSVLYVRKSGHNSPLLMAKVKMFRDLIMERIGTVDCRDLLPRYNTPEEGCKPTIGAIVDILDEVKAEYIDAPSYLPRKIKGPVMREIMANDHILMDIRTAEEKAEKDFADIIEVPECFENYMDKVIVLCGSDTKKAAEIGEKLLALDHKKFYMVDPKML